MTSAINPLTMERVMVPKNDERLKNGELVNLRLYLNEQKRKQGIKIGNGKKIITQKEYYNRYKEIIDLCLTNTPQKSISSKTGYTLKRIQYIWSRYKNAPQN